MDELNSSPKRVDRQGVANVPGFFLFCLFKGNADTVGDLHHGIEGSNCRADIDEGRVADGTPHSGARRREDLIVALQDRVDELGEDGAMRYAAVDAPPSVIAVRS